MAHSPTTERLADFAASLRPRLSGELRVDRLSRSLYATDGSMYQIEPLAVLVPGSADDVRAAVEEAARFAVPVLPRGSGTSLAGSAVGEALVIDTSRFLDSIETVDVEERTVTVGPGVVLDHLNARLAEHGLMVGPDPASSSRATIGGMVGTNATGTHSIRYGSVVDHIVSLDVVLPDGTPVHLNQADRDVWAHRCRKGGGEGDIYRRVDGLLREYGEAIRRDTPRHWRRAGGYRLERLLDPESRNLAHVMCGSEGTLGFVTGVTLGLVDRPLQTAVGVAHFESRRAALEAVGPILETDPAAVELFDGIALRRARAVEEYRPKLHFVQGDPAALLIVEYYGASNSELKDRLAELTRVLGPSGVLTRCELGAQIRDVWAVRKIGLGLAMSARLPIQCLAFIEDASVPVEHLPDYIARLEAVMAEHGTESIMYAHASAGCLHVRPFLDLREARDVQRMESIATASAELVREYGGIISSEHGDGLARSWLAPGFYGRDLYDAYVAVKRAFDPENRFNPGRVVEAPPMTEHLRVEPGYIPLTIQTEMDWSATGGFADAVEACNGNGLCRKRLEGTMCPSFMVTREEKDSTRGRANALRNVLNGSLPPEALHGEELEEVMDLCISCKACRAECPASVDMSAMKAEWHSMRWRREKPSRRVRLFAGQPWVSQRVAGSLAGIANAAASSRAGRVFLKRLGITTERSMPTFARRPFTEKEVGSTAGDRVALYADTWARFHEPEIPRAAVSVLRAAGFAPEIPAYRCCGRTLISKGFLADARNALREVLAVLHPIAEVGVSIVGLEPSCILTLRDELPRLLPDDPRARTVMAAAVTFEEFVVMHGDRFSRVYAGQEAGAALLHGHCHQKALSGIAPSIACLEAAGLQVEALDAGCCGMAGAFGYETEHVAISRAMAERVLAPAVRAADEGTAVIAAGTSCRHQIADCAGRKALHPAQVMAARIPGAA